VGLTSLPSVLEINLLAVLTQGILKYKFLVTFNGGPFILIIVLKLFHMLIGMLHVYLITIQIKFSFSYKTRNT
jgi:hypothetical protein